MQGTIKSIMTTPGVRFEQHRPRSAVIIPAYNEERSIEIPLAALADQCAHNTPLIVVNNASTDHTAAIVRDFSRAHPRTHIDCIDESEKGTGCAVDTGFRHAIEQYGAELIARTDADSEPIPEWIARIERRFTADDRLQILGGKVLALHDRHYRIGDDFCYPRGVRMLFTARSLYTHHSLQFTTPAIGLNMATTAEAYVEVGGVPRTNIGEVDEDIVYLEKVVSHFGKSASVYAPEVIARTSARRLREYGYIGTFLHFLDPDRRLRRPPSRVDIRD